MRHGRLALAALFCIALASGPAAAARSGADAIARGAISCVSIMSEGLYPDIGADEIHAPAADDSPGQQLLALGAVALRIDSDQGGVYRVRPKGKDQCVVDAHGVAPEAALAALKLAMAAPPYDAGAPVTGTYEGIEMFNAWVVAGRKGRVGVSFGVIKMDWGDRIIVMVEPVPQAN